MSTINILILSLMFLFPREVLGGPAACCDSSNVPVLVTGTTGTPSTTTTTDTTTKNIAYLDPTVTSPASGSYYVRTSYGSNHCDCLGASPLLTAY